MYAQVYDGSTVDSPVLLQHTGSETLPQVVVSSTNEMLIRFTSNANIALTGFLAVYSSV